VPTVWELARRQHGVVSRRQLLAAGLSRDAVRHRVERGRLYRVRHGVYAVGRRQLTRHGYWMAAVLSCGPGAVLSHQSAAALWGLEDSESLVTISLPSPKQYRGKGLRAHSVELAPGDIRRRLGIPLTAPARTLIDLATVTSAKRLEAAVNAADRLDLIDPERLRDELAVRPGLRGVPALRTLLDRRTFALTDSELERRFLRLARRAGLPRPQTGTILNGFKVDFHWPDLGLVVETDGLRYHRTPAQQARDHVRDQVHAVGGLRTLRFTHAQVAHESNRVVATLRAVGRGAKPRVPGSVRTSPPGPSTSR
jgi:very-short-patch-repair endonuclease